MEFRVDQIDHAELTVPNRLDAAEWYRRVLGLQILPGFQFWADDPGGPLMIGTSQGETKLALFTDTPVGSKRGVGFHLIAFRVGGEGFLQFISQLESTSIAGPGQIHRYTTSCRRSRTSVFCLLL